VCGFSGNGVGPSRLLGRIAARRALGIDDELTRSPLAQGPPAYFPPEPLRQAGARMIRAAIRNAENAEDAGRSPGAIAGAGRRLVSASTPRILEPRLRGRR
jgi:hypothetical protein